MSCVEIKVPDIGGHKNVDVIAVEIKVGDIIAIDDTLITLETDKATMDVPADAAGVVKEVKIKVGDQVSEGDVIIVVQTEENNLVATESSSQVSNAPNLTTDTTATSGSLKTISVPDIGGHQNVDVIAVEVQVGQTIQEHDTLITLETDKATMDVPATLSGVVEQVFVKVGDQVAEGVAIIELRVLDNTNQLEEAPASLPLSSTPHNLKENPAPTHTSDIPVAAFGATPINEESFIKAHAGPSARKLARELGVDLGLIKGSGRKGRIVSEDIKAFVKSAMQSGLNKNTSMATSSLGGGLDLLPWPTVDFGKFGEVEVKELSRIKKISGQNLSRNWVMIPHVTQHDDADMTELESFRQLLNKEWEREGIKLSPLAFIIKACVKALQEFPDFNASLDGENLVLKHYYHIGFAADTPNGLVVPVIRDVDKKGLKDISVELTALSKKAREGKLKPQEMQGASFTVSSLGGIGGTYFTPIINAPEVAILGVCKSQMKPVWNGKEFVPRLMCPLSLSYDHRVIDGAAACRFTTFLAKVLADFRRLSL